MNRRTVLTSAGFALGSGTAGCLGFRRSEQERRRETACSHLPDDATQPQYETEVLRSYVPLLVDGLFRHSSAESNEDESPFAYVRSTDDLETKLRLEELDETDDHHAAIRTFIEETDFETAALLVWQTTTPSTGYQVDVAGVTASDDELLHAYTCMYHRGGGNGTAVTPYNVLIRVDVHRQPRRAKLTHRRGFSSDDTHEETTYDAP